MNKQEKKALVPELRFPEFRDAGEWGFALLKNLASRRTERNRDGEIKRVLTNSAEYGVVDQRAYFDKDIANQGNLENYFVVDKGDFVYNPRISSFAPVGPISKNYVAKGVMSPLYTVFRFHKLNDTFYAHYFRSCAWHFYMHQVSSTGARHDRMAISNDDFMAMPIPAPLPEEQQKIADCLSSIDELITAQNQKLDALKAHKKGLMQQLFPAEGETVPKLRFPEFRDAGEWVYRTLGNFISERHQLPKEKVPLYSLTIEDGISPKTERYERSFLVKNAAAAYKLVKPEDFAYNPMNLRFGAIARHSRDESVALSKYYNIFYCDKSVDSRFCESYFKSQRMIAYYNDVATGSLIEKRRVHFGEFIKFEVQFPSLDEQQKIADCLSAIDELITAQAQKIESLKAHKKGLMQQLFPSVEQLGR